MTPSWFVDKDRSHVDTDVVPRRVGALPFTFFSINCRQWIFSSMPELLETAKRNSALRPQPDMAALKPSAEGTGAAAAPSAWLSPHMSSVRMLSA